ncbi:hypothetical protein [Chryseobacterium schmidteae]|uniref:hypothetical protein n=1 Tax=Chryseobacterium schmidteae TaxID=2730404 RepID=UPI00158BDB47|nr:hypothetical protein [Chryseobacterium schmidteae]
MSKKIKQDLSALINKARETQIETPKQIVVPEQTVEVLKKNADEKIVSFSFNIEKTKIEFLRTFVLFKRNIGPQFFHYSNTEAVREGIQHLRKQNADLENRPASVKMSTRKGTQGRLYGIEKLKTSFSISKDDREFIYNLIYKKDVQNGNYGKAEFFDDLIEALKANTGFEA